MVHLRMRLHAASPGFGLRFAWGAGGRARRAAAGRGTARRHGTPVTATIFCFYDYVYKSTTHVHSLIDRYAEICFIHSQSCSDVAFCSTYDL
eukprot:7243821-Prymnesium_polylepis.1